MRLSSYTQIPVRLLWLALPLILCSCATVPVMEVTPPSTSTRVILELAPGFNYSCQYEEKVPAPAPPPVRLAEANLQVLHDRQEQMIRHARQILDESQGGMPPVVDEWQTVFDILNKGINTAWRTESKEAYQQAVTRILTIKQRQRLAKIERHSLPRDLAWAKLGLSSGQRQQMLSLYLAALKKTHPAWTASAVFAESTHVRLDGVLIRLSDSLSQTDAVISNVMAICAEIDRSAKSQHDAERQIIWLRTNLEVAKDVAEKIRLRKAIMDQQAEVEKLKIAVASQNRWMTKLVLRGRDLTVGREKLAARLATLKTVHQTYGQVIQAFSELRGKAAEGIDDAYSDCFTAVKAAFRVIQQYEDQFPGEMNARRSNMERRIE